MSENVEILNVDIFQSFEKESNDEINVDLTLTRIYLSFLLPCVI